MKLIKYFFLILTKISISLFSIEIDQIDNYQEETTTLIVEGIKKKKIYQRKGSGEKYIIKNGNIHFEFPIAGKPTSEDRSLGAIIEVCASALYQLYLNDSSNPEYISVYDKVISNKDRTELFVGSKYLTNFIGGEGLILSDNPFTEDVKKHEKVIRGITFNLMIAFFLGEVDFNAGNYGVIEREEDFLFVKLDHGHSLEFKSYSFEGLPRAPDYQFKNYTYHRSLGSPVTIEELEREWEHFIPTISTKFLNPIEFKQALKRIVEVTPEQLKDVIDSYKIHGLLNLSNVKPEQEYTKFDHFYEMLIQRRERAIQQ